MPAARSPSASTCAEFLGGLQAGQEERLRDRAESNTAIRESELTCAHRKITMEESDGRSIGRVVVVRLPFQVAVAIRRAMDV